MERFDEGYSLRSILNEAEEDPNETNAAPEDGADEGEGDPNAGEEDAEDENTETEEDGGDSTDESPEDSEDEDFNIDAEDDTGDEEADIDGDEDSSDDINSDSEEEEIDADSLKALDGKLYDDLSPAEQKLKIRHLKELYTNLFYKCVKISEKLNSVFVEDDNVTLQIKMAGSTLFNLKQMISDYFLNIFDSKSYQENDIMFNRYLAMLNEVKLLTDELKKMYFNDSE